jgi:esterase/lipase
MSYVTLLPDSRPAADYAEAIVRAQAIQATDGSEVDVRCGTALLTHGHRVGRAFVLLHGITNCPQQFAVMGQHLFSTGANVFIPRLPTHGMRDRMTNAMALLTATDLVRLADAVLDCACGLADEVVVVGISGGGVLAAWAAQQRTDVARAVVIAPSLAAYDVAPWLAPAVAWLALKLPNQFWWWDSHLKELLATPPYAYPRFATRAMGEVFQLGNIVQRAAQHHGPAAQSIVVVTNEADRAVSAAPIHALVAHWRAHQAALQTYTFPAALGLPHDLIDPHHLGDQQAATYGVLLPLIDPPMGLR